MPLLHSSVLNVINSSELCPRENDNCKRLFLLSSAPNYRVRWKLIDHRGHVLRVHWLSKPIIQTDDCICCRHQHVANARHLTVVPHGRGQAQHQGGHDSPKFITYQSLFVTNKRWNHVSAMGKDCCKGMKFRWKQATRIIRVSVWKIKLFFCE